MKNQQYDAKGEVITNLLNAVTKQIKETGNPYDFDKILSDQKQNEPLCSHCLSVLYTEEEMLTKICSDCDGVIP